MNEKDNSFFAPKKILNNDGTTDQKIIQKFINEDADQTMSSLLTNNMSAEMLKNKVLEWIKDIVISSVTDNLMIQNLNDKKEWENITLFKDIKNNFKFDGFKLTINDEGLLITNNFNDELLIKFEELEKEVKEIKTIITIDDEQLKKIKEIIKDLENVETGFLTRLVKTESVKFGSENMQYQFKNIDKISFNDLDFEIIPSEEAPNQILKISIKNTIARKSDIPDISNLATKVYVDNSVDDKADKDSVLKIQQQLNYPTQPNQTFFQAIDLERNVDNGIIGLKTLFDKFFPQRHYFKFDLSFNFDTSKGNIYKCEITYKNNSMFIKFIPNGLPLKINDKTYNKITWMEYSNDYDKNFEILSWKNMLDNEHIEESNSIIDNTILNVLKNNIQITNLREGYGLHYGKVNWE